MSATAGEKANEDECHRSIAQLLLRKARAKMSAIGPSHTHDGAGQSNTVHPKCERPKPHSRRASTTDAHCTCSNQSTERRIPIATLSQRISQWTCCTTLPPKVMHIPGGFPKCLQQFRHSNGSPSATAATTSECPNRIRNCPGRRPSRSRSGSEAFHSQAG